MLDSCRKRSRNVYFRYYSHGKGQAIFNKIMNKDDFGASVDC